MPNPNGNLQTTGTATDDTGVAQVMVAIHNESTGRWWDGATQSWTTVYQETPAALDNPGGTSTNWSYTFPVPFAGGEMTVQADAVDGDGQRDPVTGGELASWSPAWATRRPRRSRRPCASRCSTSR